MEYQFLTLMANAEWLPSYFAMAQISPTVSDKAIKILDFVSDCTVRHIEICFLDIELLADLYTLSEKMLPQYARPIFIRFATQMHLTGTYKHQKVGQMYSSINNWFQS